MPAPTPRPASNSIEVHDFVYEPQRSVKVAAVPGHHGKREQCRGVGLPQANRRTETRGRAVEGADALWCLRREPMFHAAVEHNLAEGIVRAAEKHVGGWAVRQRVSWQRRERLLV